MITGVDTLLYLEMWFFGRSLGIIKEKKVLVRDWKEKEPCRFTLN